MSKNAKVLAVRRSGRARLSDMDMDLAKDRERSQVVAQNDARVKEKLRAAASGKMHLTSRNDELRDRDIFQEIRDSLRAGASVELAARASRGVIKRKVPLYVPDWKTIKAEDRKEKRRHTVADTWVKTMWIPHWDHTGDLLKAMAWAIALHEEGARTLSLNLGPEVIEAGRAHPDGLAAYIHRRIARHLKNEAARQGLPVPEFFFMIEDSDLGDAHLHGGILLPNDKRPYTAFRKALMAAGGKWRVGGSARQLDTTLLDTPVRWIGYISKWRLGSALKIRGKTFAATQGVRGMARVWYARARSTGLVLRPGPHYQDTGLIPLGA